MSEPAVELWIAPLQALGAALEDLETSDPLCPAGDLDGLDGPRRAARLLLRRLLARRFGRAIAAQPLAAGPHGKPAMSGLAGDFNVSHTVSGEAGPVALIGLGGAAAIGVDLEAMRRVRLDPRRRALISEAAVRLAAGTPLPDDEDARIVQAWARLEAWGKANGRGIGRTLTELGIWGRERARATPGVEPRVAATPASLQVHRLALQVHDIAAGPGLFGAVALPAGVPPPPPRVVAADGAALKVLLAAAVAAGAGNSGVDLAPGAGQKGRIGA